MRLLLTQSVRTQACCIYSKRTKLSSSFDKFEVYYEEVRGKKIFIIFSSFLSPFYSSNYPHLRTQFHFLRHKICDVS